MALLMKTMKRIAPRVPIVAIQPTQYKGGGRTGSGLHKDILAGLQQAYGDKVDIEELSPKDKQRILTNLYTKLALGP